MSHLVAVRHNFETAHRLPHIGGKCRSIHGHSWWVDVEVTAPVLDQRGTVVEFGAFKKGLRDWLDARLDHGAMLGKEDPLLAEFNLDGTKVFTFGLDDLAEDLAWPTVENVAVLIGRVAGRVLDRTEQAAGARVTKVTVSETHVNTACWVAS